MTPEQELYAANRAEEVLTNEAYLKAFADIEAEILEQWKTSPARDAEGREKLWLMLSLLRKVHNCLNASMQGGKLAKKELQHRQTLADRARQMMRLA